MYKKIIQQKRTVTSCAKSRVQLYRATHSVWLLAKTIAEIIGGILCVVLILVVHRNAQLLERCLAACIAYTHVSLVVLFIAMCYCVYAQYYIFFTPYTERISASIGGLVLLMHGTYMLYVACDRYGPVVFDWVCTTGAPYIHALMHQTSAPQAPTQLIPPMLPDTPIVPPIVPLIVPPIVPATVQVPRISIISHAHDIQHELAMLPELVPVLEPTTAQFNHVMNILERTYLLGSCEPPIALRWTLGTTPSTYMTYRVSQILTRMDIASYAARDEIVRSWIAVYTDYLNWITKNVLVTYTPRNWEIYNGSFIRAHMGPSTNYYVRSVVRVLGHVAANSEDVRDFIVSHSTQWNSYQVQLQLLWRAYIATPEPAIRIFWTRKI